MKRLAILALSLALVAAYGSAQDSGSGDKDKQDPTPTPAQLEEMKKSLEAQQKQIEKLKQEAAERDKSLEEMQKQVQEQQQKVQDQLKQAEAAATAANASAAKAAEAAQSQPARSAPEDMNLQPAAADSRASRRPPSRSRSRRCCSSRTRDPDGHAAVGGAQDRRQRDLPFRLGHPADLRGHPGSEQHRLLAELLPAPRPVQRPRQSARKHHGLLPDGRPARRILGRQRPEEHQLGFLSRTPTRSGISSATPWRSRPASS